MKARDPDPARLHETPDFESNILRLVKGARECRAIKLGQVDAIIDRVSGRAILLPDAQAALLERKARFRSLVELSSDGYWEQDEHYRFAMCTGAAIGSEKSGVNGIIGKMLWELPFDNHSEVDWETHRTQLEWRAIFRDLELRRIDDSGKRRIISISGEPMFDKELRFKGYHGITRDISERKQTEIGAPESDRFARATLDALATKVCVIDTAGKIITANAAWHVFADSRNGNAADCSEGDNYSARTAEVIGSESVNNIAMTAGIRQVIAGEREMFRYKCFFDTPSGLRWFIATVTRLHGVGAACAIISYEDITEITKTEQLLRLECTVARSLADSNSTSQALKAVIRAVCETQQWDCGRYFRLDPETSLLNIEESYGAQVAGVEQFVDRSRGTSIHPDAGSAGRASKSSHPIWVVNGSRGSHMSQGVPAHETGLDGAFVFPVIAEGKTLGVFAFSGRIVCEQDDRLLYAVGTIGKQVGQFLRHKQEEDALRHSEARFRRLTELSSDWYWEQDSNFRFTKIVGTGIVGAGDVLGKTLWEVPAIVLSDDEWVRHKSELAAQWSFCDLEFDVLLPDGQNRHYLISGEPVYDEIGIFSGFHGTGLDITQRKRAEIELRKSVAGLRDLM